MLPSQPAGWAGRNGGGSQSGSRIETEKASGSAKSRLSDVLMYSYRVSTFWFTSSLWTFTRIYGQPKDGFAGVLV